MRKITVGKKTPKQETKTPDVSRTEKLTYQELLALRRDTLKKGS